MSTFTIPVRAVPMFGPGSQPSDEPGLDLMPMPQAMHTFEMPRVPERADPMALAAARALLAALERAQQAGSDRPVTMELSGTDPVVLELLNQLLGEGEVSVRVGGEPQLQIQETVFAGLWRCCEVTGAGVRVRDWLEAGAMPQGVLRAARAAGQPRLAPVSMPAGVMNAPALLAEIAAHLEPAAARDAAHTINLTLLPLSADDRSVLEQALPPGPVAIISRGFGNCHIASTRVRDVWRVQYFNTMQTRILDTLEIVALPEAASAAAEDLADSRARLAELVQWLDDTP